MAIITYPLDGIDYSAADAETYLCTRTSGVFSAENNFRARVAGNRQVEISNGLAWVQNTTFKGKSICVTAPVTVDIPLADGSLPRKDRIVLRFDKAENRSKIILIEGEPSSSARTPEIKRTEQIYDLGLCIVDVPPSSLTVSAEHITSTLLDESVCGLMRDGVTGIPTAQLQEQVMALLSDLRKAFEAQLKQQDSEFDESLEKQEQEFRTWFDTIKDIIGDDPLTQFADEILNLQNAVGGNAYFAGKGKSVTVCGYSGILGNVIAHGFTEQAGSGDPSPDNVRPISVGGKKMVATLIDGETAATFYKGLYITSNPLSNYPTTPEENQLCASYLKYNNKFSDADFGIRDSGSGGKADGKLVIKIPNIGSLEEYKRYFSENPLSIWYMPTNESGATGIYVSIEIEGSEYRCECLKVNEFLCGSDTVNTNGTEKHAKAYLALENVNTSYLDTTPDGNPLAVVTLNKKAKIGQTVKCSHFKGININTNTVTTCWIDRGNLAFCINKEVLSGFGFDGSTSTIRTALNAFFADQKKKGTPVGVEYELESVTNYSNEPVQITAVPSGDGTFKVTADCELSVYQKNLKKVAFTNSYKDLDDKPTKEDFGALGVNEKAASAKAADAASGYAFYMGYLNKNAGIEAQATGVRLSWGTGYSYKLFFGQDPTYGDALCLHASSNGTYALGNSTARWASIYSTNGTIQTSDATRKEQITALGEKQLALFDKLRPVSYKLKSGFDDAENHDRLHYGFIAQEVEQAMGECGITAMEFGGLCKDKEIVLAKTLNEDGTESVASKEIGADIYSLRYQEFIALNTAAIQALKAEIAELKNQLNKLTEQLK